MTLKFSHIVGGLAVLLLVVIVGGRSSRQIKNADDFTLGGGKSSCLGVAGAIIGTLVGGSATVATSQLAFSYGFSALWYCLGGGIGCLFLAIFFVRPMRKSGCLTLQQMVSKEYGPLAGMLSSILSTLGTFLNIIVQLLSAMALLNSIMSVSRGITALIAAGLMICCVIFGGMRGTSAIGIVKTILLYLCSLLCINSVLRACGGLSALYSALPSAQYFNLFARGFGGDGGAALALIVGVLSTQTYAQSVLSAKSDRVAVHGALLSAALVPPIGLGGVLIGIYMRTQYPNMDAAQAFPQFLLLHMPGFLAGVFLCTLLIAIVTCSAGLTLGISSIVISNLPRLSTASDAKKLAINRAIVAAILLLAVFFTANGLNSFILQWSFMSMGLRGAVVLVPLCGALFAKGHVPSVYAITSIIAGPSCVLLGRLILPDMAVDPLFFGMLANFIIIVLGFIAGQKSTNKA